MKYSSIRLKDRPKTFQGDPLGPEVTQPPFSFPCSVPITLRDTRRLSDTNSNLYQLVSKRKLALEFMASHSLGAEDGGLWQTKRARQEVDMTGFEVYRQPRKTRSNPFLETSSLAKESKFNPPPLEPIVVRKELNHSILHPPEDRDREPQDRFPIGDYQHYRPLPDLSSSSLDELHARSTNSLEKYLTPSTHERPKESRAVKDHFSTYYNLYQKLTSRDSSKINSDSLVTNDPKRTSNGSHRDEDMNIFDRSNYLLGHSPGISKMYNGLEGSMTFQEYQRFRSSGFSSEEEFRKYLERDKFHKTVDKILRNHKHHGLPLTEEYIKHILPASHSYQKPQPFDVAPSRDSPVRSQYPYHPPYHSKTYSSPSSSKQSYETYNQLSWYKPSIPQDDSLSRKMRNIVRNDENRKSGPVSKESSAIISLAIKRIGRGRFGVLECLDNFAHNMYRVEKKWKDNQSIENVKNDFQEKDRQTDIEPHSTAPTYVKDKSYDEAAPLDLSTAVPRDDENNSRGSESEGSVSANHTPVENAPLPIKKRAAKYRSFSGEDTIPCSTPSKKQQNDEVKLETNDNPPTVPGQEARTCNFSRVELSGSVGLEVTLEKRLKALIETPDEDGNLPLHLAVMKIGLVHVTSALIKEMNLRNISLDRYNRQKQTPLHLAVNCANHSAVKLLINGSSSCNIPDGDGNTALHLAIEMENFEILKTLKDDSKVPVDTSTVNRAGLSVQKFLEKKKLSNEFVTLTSHILDNNNCCNTPSNYSDYFKQQQQEGLAIPSFESITPPTHGDSTPQLLYSSTSSLPALTSFSLPVLSPCRPNTPPASPPSSSPPPPSSPSSSSPPPLPSSSSLTSLTISFKPPLPHARSCLPLSSSSPSSSPSSSSSSLSSSSLSSSSLSSLSLSFVHNCGGGPMSLYAAC